MSHDHEGHSHGASNFGRAFALGIALNTAFIIIEVIYGIAAGSMALVADAAHNFSDVIGLAMAWSAFAIAKRKPTRRHTFGLRKTTVLAALANAILLLVALGGVVWEAFGRLRQPGPINGQVVIVVAAIGVVINGASALLFLKGQKSDVNVRAAFLHLASDALVALGVVVTGVIIWKTGWMRLDPLVSIAVSLVIVAGTWGLLKQSVNLALDAVPEGIDVEAVNAFLMSLPGVSEVHDLHIWAMSTTETALMAHLVMAECAPQFLTNVNRELHTKFEIGHSTLQVEPPEAGPCAQRSSDAV